MNSAIKAELNQAAALKLLLDAGADPNYENRLGRDVCTILSRSRVAENQSIQRLIKRQASKKK